MVKLAGFSGSEVVKALKRSNKLIYERMGKNHAIFSVKGLPHNISIPMHKEVAPYLLKSQLKLAGISQNEFFRLLKRKGKN